MDGWICVDMCKANINLKIKLVTLKDRTENIIAYVIFVQINGDRWSLLLYALGTIYNV